jgi:AAA15 family ATPase/GTPase
MDSQQIICNLHIIAKLDEKIHELTSAKEEMLSKISKELVPVLVSYINEAQKKLQPYAHQQLQVPIKTTKGTLYLVCKQDIIDSITVSCFKFKEDDIEVSFQYSTKKWQNFEWRPYPSGFTTTLSWIKEIETLLHG